MPVDPNFTYHHGLVLVGPVVYSVFLGEEWNSDPAHIERMRGGPQGGLKQFLSDLPISEYMNVLSQYGCGFGAGDSGCSIQSMVLVPESNDISDEQLQRILQSLITGPPVGVVTPPGAVLPQPGTPPTICVLVFLSDRVNISSFTCREGRFGYHGFFTTAGGDLLSYGVVSSASDECISEACELHPGCDQLNILPLQLDRQTIVASHEYAEMLTDPNNRGWVDFIKDPPKPKEIADITQTAGDLYPHGGLTVGGARTWQVHRIYSIASANAQQDPGVISAPNPLPKLPMAPVPKRIRPARIHRATRLANILPLPDLHHDPKLNKLVRDENDTRALVERLFHPYRPGDLVADLPGLLRDVADVIEKDGTAHQDEKRSRPVRRSR